MERHPRLHRFPSRLAVGISTVAVILAAVPASASARVNPDITAPSPSPTAIAPAGATHAPGTAVQPAADAFGTPIVVGEAISAQLQAAAAERAAAAAASEAAAATAAPATPKPTPSPIRTTSRSTTTSTPKPTPRPTPRPTPKPTPKPAPTYSGHNYMWFPAIGIRHSVASYACSASYALSYSAVYRWGCAGTNNVYLMAHAGGPFRPLYDAYNAGRLRKGMEVIYADGGGHVHYYKLQWWKTTPPDGDVAWAYESLSVPSLTLQTCVGPDSSLRLVARFVEVSAP